MKRKSKQTTARFNKRDVTVTEKLRRLIVAVREVRGHRQMNASESPDMQDAWDRLTLAVLEAEQILKPPAAKTLLDKRRR